MSALLDNFFSVSKEKCWKIAETIHWFLSYELKFCEVSENSKSSISVVYLIGKYEIPIHYTISAEVEQALLNSSSVWTQAKT